MPKEGLQYHDYYFKHYESIDKRGIKSEWEKENTKLFDKYQFKQIIENLVEESDITEKYQQFSLSGNDIVEMIYPLFYTHFEMAKDLLQYAQHFTLDNFVENFINSMRLERKKSNRDFSNYFESNDVCLKLIHTEDTLTDGERKDAKTRICKKLSCKNKTASKIYDTLESGIQIGDNSYSGNDYPYFLFKKYIKDDKDIIFYRQAYSGLIPYLMFINNKYHPTALEYMLYNPIPYSNTRNNDDETAELLSRWYNELFDTDNKCYMELSGENKILEQQLLDTYFGCSVIGYILKNCNCNCDDADDIIENVSFMGIFGLCKGTKKVINAIIEDIRDDSNVNYKENAYEEDENKALLLFEDIMKIFEKLMNGFVRYLSLKGSHNERITYVLDKRAILEPPQMSDNWKYIFAENSQEIQNKYEIGDEEDKYWFINDWIQTYACSIPSIFRDSYFFNKDKNNKSIL